MDHRPTTTLNDAIPGDRAEQLASDLQHNKSRLVIKDVVEEYVSSSTFANRVKKIQGEHLESTETYKKISDKVQTQIDSTLNDRHLKSRNFIFPIVVSVISAAGTIAAVIVAVIALMNGGHK